MGVEALMRGVDEAAKVRNVARQLGCAVSIERQPDGTAFAFLAEDPELEGRAFFALISRPSEFEKTLSSFHEAIYRARGQAKYLEQKTLCCFCDLPMNGTYEIDHKIRRSKGRDDRSSNLRAAHPACHRERHHG